jgi:hypothetical protein
MVPMSCQGSQNSASDTGAQNSAFDAAVARSWPASFPFPPLTPWLAAAVSRAEAKEWAVAIGANKNSEVLAGDTQAMLHVIGLAMGGGGTYAEAREGKKKKDKRPELPDDIGDTVPETRPINDDCQSYYCTCPFPGGGSCCQQVCDNGTTGECVECALV